MAQLLVRNLDAEIVRRLELRAAEHGRSTEEEHREILRQALCPTPTVSLKAMLLQMPNVGEDADFERNDDRGRDIDL